MATSADRVLALSAVLLVEISKAFEEVTRDLERTRMDLERARMSAEDMCVRFVLAICQQDGRRSPASHPNVA